MEHYLRAKCIDLNSPYCPCILAEANRCLFCSHLQGGDVCNCNWSGSCVLYEKTWQDKQRRRNEEAGPPRPEVAAVIAGREWIAPKVCKLVLTVPEELAGGLNTPGAFVFARKPEDPHYFHLPVGVMDVPGPETIVLVVEAAGIKSERIVNAETAILVKGPYWNGLFGLPWVEKLTHGRALIVAGGMGQAPALPVARRLVSNYNKVKAMIAPGTVGKVFTGEVLAACGVEVVTVKSLRRQGLPKLGTILREEDWDLVVSCGPDEQHNAVIAAINRAGFNIPLAATNNAIMCCGEGICGSCEADTRGGRKVRTCKTQLDYTQLLR